MRLKICLGIILAFAISLQGCGRKGPLRLPVTEVHKAATPVASSPASAVPAIP